MSSRKRKEKRWRRSDGAERYLKESSRVNSREKLAALSITNEARKCISPYYWSHIAFLDAQLACCVYYLKAIQYNRVVNVWI